MSYRDFSYSYTANVKAPCKGCLLRFVGCHDKCSRYVEYRETCSRAKEKTYRAKEKIIGGLYK